jgi:uncharacterized protein
MNKTSEFLMHISRTLIISICVIVVAIFTVSSFIHYKQTNGVGINVAGSASEDFTSDLVVWSGSFERENIQLKDAYAQIKNDADNVLKYLKAKGANPDEISFSAVTTEKQFDRRVDENGNVISQTFNGYALTQTVTIKSSEVKKITGISRDITELLKSGVVFNSSSPAYYYTKLSDLKLHMIAKATKNAQTRAKQIADNSGAVIGKLYDSKLGVFQITAQYDPSSEATYDGAFDTSSIIKTITINVRLFYQIK